MPKRYYFDRPYLSEDHQHIVVPLIAEFGTHWEVDILEFPFKDIVGDTELYAYVDKFEHGIHIVIPDVPCSRWPLPICEKAK